MAPLILWRRTRWVAFVAVTGFHLANHSLFEIGIFPALMIPATALLLPADWPRHLVRRVAVRSASAARPE